MAGWLRARTRTRARRPRPPHGRVGQNAVPETTGAGTCISSRQRKLHVTTEALAVFVATPWLISLLFRKRITAGDKLVAGVFAFVTLLVDGGLLLEWQRKRKRRTEAANNAVGALAPVGGFIDTTARVSYAGARA